MRHRPTGRFGAVRASPTAEGREAQERRNAIASTLHGLLNLSGTELRYWALIRSKAPHHLHGSTHSTPALGHRRGPVFGA
jgi:hypothetical protein